MKTVDKGLTEVRKGVCTVAICPSPNFNHLCLSLVITVSTLVLFSQFCYFVDLRMINLSVLVEGLLESLPRPELRVSILS